jgi:hypothetical protein
MLAFETFLPASRMWTAASGASAEKYMRDTIAARAGRC